jgi:hypothetical protein
MEGLAMTERTVMQCSTAISPDCNSQEYSKSNDEHRFVVEGSGTLVRVRPKERIHSNARKGGGKRNSVSRFSRGSRQRFAFRTAEICWDSIPKSRCFYLRVTFLPPQGSLNRPKKCLALFWKRLQAFFGPGGYSGVWKQEYTRNGAWHVHIFLVIWRTPRSLARRDRIECNAELPVDFSGILAGWTARAWSSALGWKGEGRCPENATYCEKVRSVRGAVNYLAKGPGQNAKGYETNVPKSARPEGRWWGIVGAKRLPKSYQSVDATLSEFQEVRRNLADVVGNRSSGACQLPIWSATSPLTAIGGAFDGELFEEVKRHVDTMRSASQFPCLLQDAEPLSGVAA